MDKQRKTLVKRIMAAVIALVVTASIITFPDTTSYAAQGKVKSITVTNLPAKQLTLKKGKKFKLKTKVSVSGTISKKVAYKTSNKKIATVSSGGTIAAKKNGKATITIYSKADKKVKCKIKVTVGNPVTKVTLNKTKVTVTRGKTFKLKATVSPTKASCKSVIWKSSNTSVATVSSKGIVTTKKAGTAKVTAVAKDGSGKKKTCVVTVKNPVVIQSFNVINQSVLKVTLSDTCKLSKADFVVKKRQSKMGTYNRTVVLDSIITSDNKTYLLMLDVDPSERILDNECVKLSISKLKQEKEAVYTTGISDKYKETCWSQRVGYELNSDFYQTTFDSIGYTTFSIAGTIPQGVTVEKTIDKFKSYLIFSGTPEKAGTYVTTIKGIDERGSTYTQKITWLIYDDTNMKAYTAKEYGLITGEGYYTVYSKVTVKGGSGSYDYSVEKNADGIYINQTGYVRGNIYKPGVHTYNVIVTDQNNPEITTTVQYVCEVKKGICVRGVVKDAAGNPLGETSRVTFINKDKEAKYTPKYEDVVYKSDLGYQAVLEPGTYDIIIGSTNSQRCLLSQKITTSKSGYDITLPVHKVVVSSDNKDIGNRVFADWYDKSGRCYGSGKVLYLKSGTYALTSSSDEGVVASLNITVQSEMYVNAKVTLLNQKTVLGQNNISIKNKKRAYYVFIPDKTGKYGITISDTENTPEGKNVYIVANYFDGSNKFSTYSNGNTGSQEASISFKANKGSPVYFEIEVETICDDFPLILNIEEV